MPDEESTDRELETRLVEIEQSVEEVYEIEQEILEKVNTDLSGHSCLIMTCLH